jgi:type II secretory pathway predicted ATPase ExeA
MSYLKHWKLDRSPFSIAGNRRAVFTGGTVEEALARSEFLIDQGKRLGLVIGPSGVGKTTLLEQLILFRNAQKPREHVVRVDLRAADKSALPLRIANALELDCNPNLVWADLQDHFFASNAMGHQTVLLFDSIADASEDIFLGLQQFWGICPRTCNLVCLDDDSLVNLPRWMLEWCELKIELPCWDLGQTADYFEFALVRAGGREDLFDAQSITRIQELSDGTPRKISQIADLALVAGAVRRSQRITADLVDQVCDEFTVSIGPKFPLFWEDQQLNAG